MLFGRYLSLLNRVTQENGLLKLALVCLTGISVMQWQQAKVCREQVNTILVPPGAEETMRVSAQGADAAYLRQISRYIADLSLNYTPSNVKDQFSELLSLYAPSVYPTVRVSLEKTASDIVTSNLVQTFHLQEKILVQGQVIRLKGLLYQRINNQAQPPVTAEYRVRFVIKSGRFFISEMWKFEPDEISSEEKEKNVTP